MAKQKKLTQQEKIFALSYVTNLKPEEAAKEAGYSDTVARSKAYQWVSDSKHKPHLYKYIQELIEKKSKKLDITSDRVLEEIARLAFLDISQLYNDDGSLIPIKELPEDVRRSISGIEVQEKAGSMKIDLGGDVPISHIQEQTKKIKTYDKVKSLEILAKYLKLLTNNVEVIDKTPLKDKLTKDELLELAKKEGLEVKEI